MTTALCLVVEVRLVNEDKLDELVQFRLKLRPRVVMALRGQAVERSTEAGRFVSWCVVAREILEREAAHKAVAR